MIKFSWSCLFAFVLISNISYASASQANSSDHAIFEKIFTDWTAAFNRKDLTKSCALFSNTVIANYQGFPTKNYSMICGGFKTIFALTNKTYRYRFTLHEVYRSGDLAAARITWYLDVDKNGKRISSVKDEGLDVLERDAVGDWKIINYLAYPVVLL